MSNFNSSANDSTSTAPTASTTTNGDIGLNFASPKKITALEAYTPERGSKGNHSGTIIIMGKTQLVVQIQINRHRHFGILFNLVHLMDNHQ